MANSYTFDQIATILNAIVSDAQGRTASIATTPRNTAQFVTMATTAIAAGTDPIMHALTSMINRTVFQFRPYTGKLRILDNSDVEYGNTIRKVTPIFHDGAEAQPMYDDQPVDGSSTDQWKIKRPQVLQTLFTGAEQWEVQAPTVFVDQLKSAFRGPDELSQFMAAQTTEVANEIEQQREQLARMTLANFIGAKIKKDSSNVIHLLTEYNTLCDFDTDLTDETVYQPQNFPAFIKWVYARIEELSDKMTERSVLYHQPLTNYTILRHSPKADQRLILYAPAMAQIKTMVMSGLYNDTLLKMAPHESINFWQNINNPDAINVTCRYLDDDGTTNTDTITKSKIFGVLYDREAMGYNILNQGVAVSPLNAKGMYYNQYHHMVKRFWNDGTQNGIVFLLD